MGRNAFDNIKAKLDSIVTVNYSFEQQPTSDDQEIRSSPDGSESQRDNEIAGKKSTTSAADDGAFEADDELDELGDSAFDLILRRLKRNLGDHLNQERKVKMATMKPIPAAVESSETESEEEEEEKEEVIEEMISVSQMKQQSAAKPSTLRDEYVQLLSKMQGPR